MLVEILEESFLCGGGGIFFLHQAFELRVVVLVLLGTGAVHLAMTQTYQGVLDQEAVYVEVMRLVVVAQQIVVCGVLI